MLTHTQAVYYVFRNGLLGEELFMIFIVKEYPACSMTLNQRVSVLSFLDSLAVLPFKIRSTVHRAAFMLYFEWSKPDRGIIWPCPPKDSRNGYLFPDRGLQWNLDPQDLMNYYRKAIEDCKLFDIQPPSSLNELVLVFGDSRLKSILGLKRKKFENDEDFRRRGWRSVDPSWQLEFTMKPTDESREGDPQGSAQGVGSSKSPSNTPSLGGSTKVWGGEFNSDVQVNKMLIHAGPWSDPLHIARSTQNVAFILSKIHGLINTCKVCKFVVDDKYAVLDREFMCLSCYGKLKNNKNWTILTPGPNRSFYLQIMSLKRWEVFQALKMYPDYMPKTGGGSLSDPLVALSGKI